MAGPPSSAFGQITFQFSGPALPHGAVTTLGITWPSISQNDSFAIVRDESQLLQSAISTSSVSLDQVLIKQGPESSGPSFEVLVGQLGGQTADSASPNTALLIRKSLADTSQRFAGRMYWPGVAAGSVDEGGFLLGDDYDDYQAAITQFFAALETQADMSVVVFSADSSDVRPVSALLLQTQVATQRRRLRR